jgi:hypothetical protein
LEPIRGTAKEKLGRRIVEVVEDVIHARITRIKHSCDPNSFWSRDGDTNAVVIIAQRDIQVGEEIIMSYIPWNDPKLQRLTVTTSKKPLLETWGITCDQSCLCNNAEFVARFEEYQKIYQGIEELKRVINTRSGGNPQKVLQEYDKILKFCKETNGSHMGRMVLNTEAFEFAVQWLSTAPKAQRYLKKMVAYEKSIAIPNSPVLY